LLLLLPLPLLLMLLGEISEKMLHSPDASGGEAPAKKQRATWSAEAVALGYETGTIKHAAYVLLAASGTSGMTVASIVESAQKQGLYSWGTCKTPNNSVTAALSQDTTFVRIAPSTYALRSSLRGGAANVPVPQQRTSSSTNSGAQAESARADSGSASGGAVAGGRSNGSNANSKARPEREGHDKPKGHGGGEFSGGYANALAQQLHQAGRVAGGKESQAKRLAMESYKRRMDVYAGQIGGPADGGDRNAFVFPEPTRPAHSPDAQSAGSCLFFYPTTSQQVPPPKKPEPHKEPTEGLKRATSWKDEAKQYASDDFSGVPVPIERTSSGHLPAWVLEQFKAESKNPIAAA